MTLIEQYSEISEDIIKNDAEIRKYEKDLLSKEMYICKLIYTTKMTKVLMHPIKFVKTNRERFRLESIQKKYNVLRNSRIDENIEWEKADEFGDDLEKAAKIYKIGKIRDFISKNPINDENIDKKLL